MTNDFYVAILRSAPTDRFSSPLHMRAPDRVLLLHIQSPLHYVLPAMKLVAISQFLSRLNLGRPVILLLKACRRSSNWQRVSFILFKVSIGKASGSGIHTISLGGVGKEVS